MRRERRLLKKSLSILLSLAMVFGIMPGIATAAFADVRDTGPLVGGAEEIGNFPLYPFLGERANLAKAASEPVVNQIHEDGYAAYFDRDGGAAGEGDFVASTSKTIEQVGENEFEIKLQVKTTVDTGKIEVSPDAAVVLVIDLSGTMNFSPNGDSSVQTLAEYPYVQDSSGNNIYRNEVAAGQRIYSSLTNAQNGITSGSVTNRPVYSYDNGGTVYYSYNANNEWCQLGMVMVSGSPRYYLTSTYFPVPPDQTRLALSKAAAIDFLDSFVADAGDAVRMVSIVTFKGTGSGTGQDQYRGYSEVAQDWVDVTDSGSLEAAKSTINSMTAELGTFTQGGLMLARNLYLPDNAPTSGGEAIDNRFVIMLTDGNPTHILRTGSSGTNPDISSTSLSPLTSNNLNGTEVDGNISPSSNASSVVADQIRNGGFNSNYTAKL
ncbi:MAG: VWA domain-containing protein, partial [Clostridiales bacterium]|nr:VWA domain-containing protein [Clostridiales bacterium]